MVEEIKRRRGLWTTKQGRILGQNIAREKDGTLSIEDGYGTVYKVIYGTIDESGKIIEFCSDKEFCGIRCIWSGTTQCRYNKKSQKNAGYYIEVQE